jgi:beta-galactosidase
LALGGLGVWLGAPATGAQMLAPADPPPRLRIALTDGWRYQPSEATDDESGDAVDDAAWQSVSIPHTWNALDAFDKQPGYRRGTGWYRRALTVDPTLAGKRLYLYFQGANQQADVWVNGTYAGRHVGGYTAFAFEITRLVRPNRPNVIAVRVNNSPSLDVPPISADFTFYGGIYRPVWLVATAPAHFDMLDHGSSGVWVDAPAVSAAAATVRVTAAVRNDGPATRHLQLATLVLDGTGREVARFASWVTAQPGATVRVRATSAPIGRPHLWSPETPTLYHVVTELRDGGRVVDQETTPFGFRWFRVDSRRGFILNGQPYALHGASRHQDRAGMGNALPEWANQQDMQLIKQTGFNCVRLAHYPQDQAVLDEADRLGLIVWEEIPVVNQIGLSAAFDDRTEDMLVEMIRQHYNHPAIAFWGLMNEIMQAPPHPIPDGYSGRILALARRLNARAHAEDSTRLSAATIAIGEVDNGSGLQNVTDVLGINLYFGWYYGRFDGLGPFLTAFHARHPDRPVFVTEYGAGSDERIHSTNPVAFDFSSEYAEEFHESEYPQLRDRAWLVGSAVWNQFDFGAEDRNDSRPTLNNKGLFNFDRTPKDVAYYYRAMLSHQPVVHIATRDFLRRAGSRPDERLQPVTIYTNLKQVELFLDQVSLGRRRPDNASAEWLVPFHAGENHLTARATTVTGQPVEDMATVSYDDRTTLFGDLTSAARVLAVNVGSTSQYIDAGGTVWEADHLYRFGSWGYVGGHSRAIHDRIAGTDEDGLFQTSREGASAYRFDVADGEYDCKVAVVETLYHVPGERVFTMRINGTPVFTALDLVKQYGRDVAVQRTVRVTAAGGSGITIQLTPIVGETTISGIVLTRR